MSLNFNLTAIPEDVRTIVNGQGETVMNPVTHSLIWITMGVGIGVIDDNTLEEFVARVELIQKLDGALMNEYVHGDDPRCPGWHADRPKVDGAWIPRPITREEIEAHKGLSTNVFPVETRTSWLKRTMASQFPHAEPKRRR